ncbi:MAG: NifU family protein [Armatimonadetes bacterium]|nr:NifU family protein [Armatimonadota bacterium]
MVNITKTKKTESNSKELKKKVEIALSQVRPYLQADGGDVELIDVDEISKTVKVRLIGACAGCPGASMTLKAGVEEVIMKNVPEIKKVEADLY